MFVGGGIDINRLVGAAACCVCGLVFRGGRGGGGVGSALLVVGGAGVGVALARGLGVPLGPVGVACVPRCGSCGPWLVAVPRCGWEAAAWASRWGCGP